MNLNRRLILANAAAVIVPVIITAVAVLAFVFIYVKLFGAEISLTNYRRLSEIKLELLSSEQGISQQQPGAIEQASWQKYWRERLAAIGGELIIVKDKQVLFKPGNFSQIDLAKCLEAGSSEQVEIAGATYRVQPVEVDFQDGSHGSVLLLAPVERSESELKIFLAAVTILFAVLFTLTNFFVSYRFSRSIIAPLNNLKQAAAEISAGNLDRQILAEGDQEIQELCRDLELMRIKLKESIRTQLKYEDNRKLLVSSMSHDLKTPVTSIKGYVEGIMDGIANTREKRERYLTTIFSKAQQLDRMLDDLLLYAKLDINQIPFDFQKVDVAQYLQESVTETEPELESQGITIGLVNELSQTRYILMDRERMQRVITNILDNSRKYLNKEHGEIKILLRETNASVIIELRDNGSGIPEDDLPYVFDRFFRSDAARSTIKGSGLGLAIAKQIVEGHNGRIWALSHGKEGTSIMISLSKL